MVGVKKKSWRMLLPLFMHVCIVYLLCTNHIPFNFDTRQYKNILQSHSIINRYITKND